MKVQYDRSLRMGLFPHDRGTTIDLEPRPSYALAKIAGDPSNPFVRRDSALWNLLYRGESLAGGLFAELASHDSDQRLRQSAAWALFKSGNVTALHDCLTEDDDGNTRAWKRSLLNEALGSSAPADDRPIRSDEKSPFDLTMPMTVEGEIQFQHEGTWYRLVVSEGMRTPLVGEVSGAVRADSFMTTLIIQKRLRDPNGDGRDHIEGYLFRGLSRPSAVNSMSHYYEAFARHPFYRSGKMGDESRGVVDVDAHLFRIADTDLIQRPDLPWPFPQTTRGVFYGSVYMNPAIISNPDMPLDGLLQIVSTSTETGEYLANGWFYGTFRGVLRDLDGDGKVDINGIEFFVDEQGQVLERRPPTDSDRKKKRK